MQASSKPQVNQVGRSDQRQRWLQGLWAVLASALVALVLMSCSQTPTAPVDEAGPDSLGDKDLRFERLLSPRPGITSGAIRTSSIDGSDFELVGGIGAPPTGPGEFNIAAAVAVSADGIVYVSDYFNDRVQRFDANGTFLGAWGSPGTGPGEFAGPAGIAVGSDGHVYVVDSGNHRVQRFDATGVHLGQWGHRGSGDGAFERPGTIVVGPSGALYVLDKVASGRIQRFSAGGTFELAWSAGAGEDWEGIAVAPETGEVFVTDYWKDSVHVFDPDGSPLASWGSRGGSAGELYGPSGITVTSDGRVYVQDLLNRVQHFSPDGEYLGHWGAFGFDEGRFNTPWGAVAVATNGDVFVADSWNHRIQVFDSDGKFLRQWGNDPYAAGRFNLPSFVALAPSGRLYVAEPRRDRVQAFDAQGALQSVVEGNCPREFDWFWLRSCTGPGQFTFPMALTVDADERVHLLDRGGLRVKRFASDLSFETAWGEDWHPSIGDEVFRAEDLAATSEGHIAVVGSTWNDHQVRQFDGDGQELVRWTTEPFQWIWTLGAGPNGSLHLGVEVYRECEVVVFDAAGNKLRRWLAATTAENTACGFLGLAIDAYGNTYATVYGIDWSDYGHTPVPEVLVFDRYGRERTRFGGPDTLRTPAGIDVGADGTVAVADQLGHRVQLFAPKVQYAFGGFEPPVGPGLNLVDAGRTVPVRFGLGGDHGSDVAWAIDSEPIDCDSLEGIGDPQPIAGPGGSGGVRFDRRTQTYGINWKTEGAWRGTCREFVLMLSDMSVHSARFRFE